MKRIASLLLVATVAVSLSAQNFAAPESVVFDETHNRYLISNVGGGGFIMAFDVETGQRTEFVNVGVNAPKGMAIYNGVVYVTDVTKIEGFSLEDASHPFSLAVAGSSFLNDMAISDEGIMYVSDNVKDMVYRIDLATSVITSFAASGMDAVNGVLIDAANDRLLTCHFDNAGSIKAINLNSGAVSTIMTTGHPGLDGFTVDNCGNYYVSSWDSHAILQFQPDLSAFQLMNLTGLDGPADIFFNQFRQELCIPDMNKSVFTRVITWLPCVYPDLTDPADGSENQTTRNLGFNWMPTIASRSYHFQLSKDVDFAEIVASSEVSEPAFIAELLDVNTVYYWRVAAAASVDQVGVFSPPFAFKTEESSSVLTDPYSFSWAVYPNPVTDNFMIRWKNSGERPIEFALINVLGEVALRLEPRDQHTLQLLVERERLQDGVYVLRALTDHGNLYHQRIILR